MTTKKNKMVRIWVRLSDKELARLKLLADAAGLTPGKMLAALLEKGADGGRPSSPEPMQTLVALVRVPVRVADGLRCVRVRVPWLCQEWVGGGWEAEFDECEEWAEDVRARFGCAAEDRGAFEGLAAGFVESGSDAEKTIMEMLAE